MIRHLTLAAMALLFCGACARPAAPPTDAPAAPASGFKHETAMKMEHSTVEPTVDAPRAFDQMPPSGTKARCAVTDELFAVSAETPASVYQGKTYVFCCASCKPRFDAAPEKYARK